MSSGLQKKRTELLGELRQFTGLGASFFRTAAAQIGMTITDMQVLDTLESTGPATAGQLADLTGLTTGAITGMLNRLEEGGLVRRERDPNDGRRVIVHLVPGKGEKQEIGPLFAPLSKAWDEITADYDDEQLAFLLDFLKRSNALTRREIILLQEAPAGKEGVYSAALGGLESARLVVSSAVSQLNLRAEDGMTDLYQARFEGPAPDVKVKEGVVTMRYPRRLLNLSGGNRKAEIMLSTAIPWQIVIQGGASGISAELSGLNLTGLEIKGGLSSTRLDLPTPKGMIPIRVSGGASDITIHRPAGVAARVHLKGWASGFVFDDQTFSYMGNDVRLQSPDFDPTVPCYDIEVACSVSMVTITTS